MWNRFGEMHCLLGREVSIMRLPLLLFVLSGCAALAVSGQFQSGRRALIAGDPETAASYFSSVADQNPNYVNIIQNYRESVWTYLGRAQYETKRYAEARKSLDRALSLDKDDQMARLYLGLTLMQTGDAAQGTKDVEAGMKGLYDWIEYMNRTQPFQAFWDPSFQIRKQIDQSLGAIASKDFQSEQFVADAGWVGQKFEEELDKVRQDERRQFERERDGRGLSVGVGVGF
jgi:tetratricopeptide (TPR) repeat protein